MRISRRDKVLLVLLAIVAALAAYYFFGIVPQEEKIAELEAELAMKEAAKSEIELKLASEFNLDKRIEELEKAIGETSEGYFGELTQEEVLMLVTGFSEGMTMSFSDLTFSENKIEGSQLYQTTANMSYSGDYQALMAYLRNTRTFEKKIVVKEVTVQNGLDDGLTGRLQLEFNGIPAVEAYSVPYKRLVTSQFNPRDLSLGPFAPYDNFVVLQPTEPAPVDTTTPIVDDFPNTPVYPTEGGTPIDYPTYRPKTQVYGFEDGANFFVGNNPDIKGFVSRNTRKIAGGYSAEMSFDFTTGRDFSEANLVFDTNPVMINRQAEYIGLWVHTTEMSNHGIGVVIIDSKGKEYRVEMTKSVDFTGWKEIEAPLPVEITYPCMIQRVYVEGIGYGQKLTGKYLFDQLSVAYPVQ
ncbi:MAG TPA: hypothetical protein DCS67_03785 [Clostridiales bacterium UBA8960]|nr:hypothetical protein [Clostridiales bacterium UBA8960]